MNATWVPSAAAAAAGATSISVTGAVGTRSDFEKELGNDCGLSFSGIGRCVLMIFYYVAMALPSLLLWASAQFFNAMISLGIDSKLTSDSTLFPKLGSRSRSFQYIFILVLLYVAIQTILGLSHETKTVIINVIIMALLINFSMFFTKVVIDSSNILALVFYNKLIQHQQLAMQQNSTLGLPLIMKKCFRNHVQKI